MCCATSEAVDHFSAPVPYETVNCQRTLPSKMAENSSLPSLDNATRGFPSRTARCAASEQAFAASNPCETQKAAHQHNYVYSEQATWSMHKRYIRYLVHKCETDHPIVTSDKHLWVYDVSPVQQRTNHTRKGENDCSANQASLETPGHQR